MLVNFCCCDTQHLHCSPCSIPKKNLTLTWVNTSIGTGSTTLVYTPPNSWAAGCINQLIYQLSCPGTSLQFSITYFLSGVCPTGQSQSCNYPGFDPFAISLIDYTCDPFHLHFQVTGPGCPVMWSVGYTDFYIDE